MPGPRCGLAGGEESGQVGGAVPAADREDDNGGEGVAGAELGADGGAVEAAHLMDGEPVGLRLGDERGDSLPGVILRPRLRPAVVASGAGGDEDQCAGGSGPGLVAGSQGREEPAVSL